MSIMYNLTRQETADKLKISTRSVDRYIKAGKLRSKKEGKIVYVNLDDVNNMITGGKKKQEVIIEPNSPEKTSEVSIKQDNNNQILGTIYKDLKEEIVKKDEMIQVLSVKLGKAEEIANNSISVMEYKKSQFLLEESKGYLNKEVSELKNNAQKLKKDLEYEKKSNLLLIIFVILLLVIAGAIWFIKI